MGVFASKPVGARQWGRYSLDSSGLTTKVTDALYDANCLTYYGLYDQAESKYAKPPLRGNTHPLVIIMRSVLYADMGLDKNRLETLKECAIPSNREAGRAGADIWDLVELLLSIADGEGNGKGRQAMQVTLRIIAQLAKRNTSDYDNIELLCAFHCHHVLFWCNSWSNWLDEVGFTKPSAFPSVSDIRQLLQDRGQFGDSARILPAESDSNNHDDPTAPFQGFLDAIAAEPKDTLQTCTIVYVNIKFAERLLDLHRSDEALHRLEIARRSLEMLSSRQAGCWHLCPSRSPEQEFPRLWLLLSAAVLRLEASTAETQVEKTISLANTAFKKKNFLIYRSLVISVLKLAEDHEFKANESELNRLRETINSIHVQSITVEESITCSALHEEFAIMRYRTWKGSHGGQVSRGPEISSMIDGFISKHPQYDFPFQRWMLHRNRAEVASAFGMKSAESRHTEIASSWRRQCPPNIGLDAIDIPDIDDNTAKMLWEPDSRLHDPASADRTINSFMFKCATLISRWTRWELEDGELSTPVAKTILRWTDQRTETINESYTALESSHMTSTRILNDVTQISPMSDTITFSHEILTQCNLSELASNLIGDQKPRVSDDWEPWFNVVETWLDKERRRPSRFQRLLVLKQLQFCRGQSISQYSLKFPLEQEWANRLAAREGQRQLDLANRLRSIDSRLITVEDLDAARFSQANCICLVAGLDNSVTDQDLQNAVTSLKTLFSEVLARGTLHTAYHTQIILGNLQWKRYKLFSTTEPWHAIQCWSVANELGFDIRLEYSSLGAAESFLAKETLSLLLIQSQFHQIALMACIESIRAYYLSTPHKRALYDEQNRLWQITSDLFLWIQRGKSRSLLEALGPKQNPPLTLLRTVGHDVEMTELWEKVNSLMARVTTSTPLQKIALREQIKTTTDVLRNKDETVKSFLDLRDGHPIGVSDFLQLRQELGPSVVIVEWVELTRDLYDTYDILLVLYQQGSLATPCPISGLKQLDVDKWVTEFLGVEDLADSLRRKPPLSHSQAKQDLNLLRPLVAQLIESTKPGDTLVFCPTGRLHRLPLHAITFDGIPLIERNPIVYIQSLSLLRLCCKAVKFPETTPEHVASSFSSTIFNTLSGDSPRTNQALSTLADSVPGCELISLSNFTNDRKALFQSKCEVSNIVHIHGHADYEEGVDFASASQQCLNLREPSSGPADKLSVDEIFSTLRFRQPSIVLAMGCRTGRSHISAVNDLLGLTAAFHFAGAGAVIGALWKISENEALRFAEAFYGALVHSLRGGDADGRENVNEQGGNSGDQFRVVDLARAYQHAVLTVRKDANGKVQKPYHWAGLVFHGAWMFQYSSG